MFLEKPNILVMTQRELTDEEYNVQKRRTFDKEMEMESETGTSSEEEFYDVADEHIRDVAQQLLDALVEPEPEQDEERVATPIVADDEQEGGSDGSDDTEESGSSTPVLTTQETVVEGSDEKEMDVEEAVIGITEALVEEVSAVEPEAELGVEQEVVEPSVIINQEVVVEDVVPLAQAESAEKIEKKEKIAETETFVEEAIVATVCDMLDAVPEVQVREEELVPLAAFAKEETTLEAAPVAVEEKEKDQLAVQENVKLPAQQVLILPEKETVNDNGNTSETPVIEVIEHVHSAVDKDTVTVYESSEDKPLALVPAIEAPPVHKATELIEIPKATHETIEMVVPIARTELVETEPHVEVPSATSSVSQETTTLMNPETAKEVKTIANEPMPTLVISDEVKTSQTTGDDDLSDCSIHQVKVDFDGYSSGKEESLSSSTSSESFEFTDNVPSSNVDEERTQAIRDSINERYPTNGSDDEEELDVGAEYDEDLLAVKQISAEVEQLVAAINAFGWVERNRRRKMETWPPSCLPELDE